MWAEELLSCWYGSLDLLCLSGFGIDDCIAAGVMLPAALGIIHSCDSWKSYIWKEAVKAALLSVFKEDLTNFLVKPKRTRHDLRVEAQYPQAPTSTAEKCMDQSYFNCWTKRVIFSKLSSMPWFHVLLTGTSKFYNYYCFCGSWVEGNIRSKLQNNYCIWNY